MLRIAVAIVGTARDHFRSLAANRDRLALARRISAFTAMQEVDAVVLPAGFLAAMHRDDVDAQARELARLFADQTLIAGVDEIERRASSAKGAAGKSAGKSAGAPNTDGYHYWVFASVQGRLIGEPWRQRAASSGQEVSDPTARCVPIGDARLGVLICGELYNPALAASLAEAAPDAVVDVAHLSMTRFSKSLLRVATTACRPVLHVQHVGWNSGPAAKWQATPAGVEHDRGYDWASYEDPDAPADAPADAPWAEVKIWKLPGPRRARSRSSRAR